MQWLRQRGVVEPLRSPGRTRGRGSLPYEVGKRHTDRVGDADQRVDTCCGVALLDAVVRAEGDTCPECDVFLREVRKDPCGSDLVANCPAAGENPFSGQGRVVHLSTFAGS